MVSKIFKSLGLMMLPLVAISQTKLAFAEGQEDLIGARYVKPAFELYQAGKLKDSEKLAQEGLRRLKKAVSINFLNPFALTCCR